MTFLKIMLGLWTFSFTSITLLSLLIDHIYFKSKKSSNTVNFVTCGLGDIVFISLFLVLMCSTVALIVGVIWNLISFIKGG